MQYIHMCVCLSVHLCYACISACIHTLQTKPLTVTVNTSPGHNSLTSKLYQFLNNYNSGNPNPASLLDSIGYK